MTAPLTDRERALCREAAVEAVRLYCEEHLGPPTCDSAPNPEPAPELPEVEHNGCRYRYNPEAHYYEYLDPDCGWRCLWTDPALVRALAPLLPKRELTDEIVEKAITAFMSQRSSASYEECIRAALLSVWDDIAAPAAPAPTPQWWAAVLTADGKSGICFDNPDDAQDMARRWYGTGSRVVALAEVKDAP